MERTTAGASKSCPGLQALIDLQPVPAGRHGAGGPVLPQGLEARIPADGGDIAGIAGAEDGPQLGGDVEIQAFLLGLTGLQISKPQPESLMAVRYWGSILGADTLQNTSRWSAGRRYSVPRIPGVWIFS